MLSCIFCEANFRSSNTWVAHMCRELKYRLTESAPSCPSCKYSFSSCATMVAHLLKRECLPTHPKDRCDYCNMLFTTTEQKNLHVQNVCIPSIEKMIIDDGSDLFDDDCVRDLDSYTVMIVPKKYKRSSVVPL